ncbi:hypothetical protein NYE70_11310 [Paenibacillus sp. FSL R5-0407]|uniref:hypothetical protein n=1 Tax=Paenibacillus sp. FSL R5-0407 TaxID=2975320 RepID=UPI0030FAF9C3
MKQQKVVRTYPKGYLNPTSALSDALNSGWVVVMSNPFDCGKGEKGTEYILEKTTPNK